MEKGLRKNIIKKFDEGYLYDRETLYSLLLNGFPGYDVMPVVDELLSVFPSVNAVLHADYLKLTAVKGVTDRIAQYIVTLHKAQELFVQPPTSIVDSDELIEYGIKKSRGMDCEEAELFCVNKAGKVVAFFRYRSKLMKKVDVRYPDVAADIAASGASGFYFLHNHVYGAIRPSEADDVFTAKLIAFSASGGATFYDHCIVGERDGFSYRNSGRITALEKELEHRSRLREEERKRYE